MIPQHGGCLCGALRYHVTQPPDWVTVCFCTFCQRATGAQGLVEPIFPTSAFAVTHGSPRVYTHISSGSGQQVHVHFCPDCGTKSHLTFARWPDRLGVYSGSFDDPNWFDMTPETTKYIFLDNAPRGTLIPAGFRTYAQHAADASGTPLDPVVFEAIHHIR
jgi:hypothetical protein